MAPWEREAVLAVAELVWRHGVTFGALVRSHAALRREGLTLGDYLALARDGDAA
jgi:hypothetical protein